MHHSTKKILTLTIVLISLFFSSCKKDKDNDDGKTTAPAGDAVLRDFAAVVANPNYEDIKLKAGELKAAVEQLSANTDVVHLLAAQQAWRDVRIPWEQAEAYLFGPAEDFDYDPATDTWPVNTTELDSLLASTNSLQLSDIEGLQYSLVGYHPIEYVLFGVGGSRTPAELSSRHLLYLVSLATHLYNVTAALRSSWDVNEPNNFTVEFTTAGIGSNRYTTKKDAFLAVVVSLRSICDEVADGKMETPLAAHDSSLVESQYAHNATTDFKNNMIGVENVYLARYGSATGSSLHDMVAAADASLDNAIRTQITACIAALEIIDPNYGLAIYTQQGQIIAAQQTIRQLSDFLGLLENFIHTHVTD